MSISLQPKERRSGDPYTPYVSPRALAYHREGRRLHLFSIAWRFLGLWFLLRAGLSVWLRNGVHRLLKQDVGDQADASPPPQRRGDEDVRPEVAWGERERSPSFLALTLFYAGYVLFILLWTLPLGLVGLSIEHRYGFSRQSVGSYLYDDLISGLFGMITVLPLWFGYRLYRRAGRSWWLWLWAILVPLLFASIVLEPIVFEPAFNRFTPLTPGPLRDQLLALANKAGIQGGHVYVQDTSRRSRHVNAYVTGLGPTTRIVLNDTALQQLPTEEILAMMGHEMGHYVEGHIWIGWASGSLGIGLFLWLLSRTLPWAVEHKGAHWGLSGVMDLAALPLLLLIINCFMLIQAPIANAESRYMEHRADAFGLRVTHLHDATARLFVGFAERDFSDPNPPALYQFWFGSHPTLAERIAFARESAPKP